MIHRQKDFLHPPANLVDKKWDAIRADALIEKDLHEVKSECYRDTVLEDLTQLYKRKCAICERLRGNELAIDHYRPKKPRNNKTHIKYNQPGYYWLTYEWSNLIPVCSKCNEKKSNKFPLKGWTEKKRISDHLNKSVVPGFAPYDINWLQNYETPLLVNPELETQPAKHFKFYPTGIIEGRTAEGVETINVCCLNRKDLVFERRSIKEKYIIKIKSALDDYITNRDDSELRGELRGAFKEIKAGCDFDEAFSLFHEFIYNYYDVFIEAELPINLRGVSVKYFSDFKRLNSTP